MQGKVRYVIRPVLPSGCEAKSGYCGALGTKSSLNLGGYGVELALKNMEYKAMDDSTVKKGLIFFFLLLGAIVIFCDISFYNTHSCFLS